MGIEVMAGRMIGANFEEDTLTFEMDRGYYAAAGKYVIVRESDYLSETEQRAELLEALQEIMPAFEGLMADKENVEWHDCWNKAVAAIANATQQRNATGGEG